MKFWNSDTIFGALDEPLAWVASWPSWCCLWWCSPLVASGMWRLALQLKFLLARTTQPFSTLTCVASGVETDDIAPKLHLLRDLALQIRCHHKQKIGSWREELLDSANRLVTLCLSCSDIEPIHSWGSDWRRLRANSRTCKKQKLKQIFLAHSPKILNQSLLTVSLRTPYELDFLMRKYALG